MWKQTSLAAAFLLACQMASAAEITIVNWNIQTLVHPTDTVTVFDDDYRRQSADFDDLRRWRDLTAGDVFLLQEVTSPAAIDAIFPAREGWRHCISGQYAKAEGLPPGPVCTSGTITPQMPASARRAQHTAIAIRPGVPVTLSDVTDIEGLDVKHLDGDETRDLRWGLQARLASSTGSVTLLVVHMKSGCFDDRIDQALWLRDPVEGEVRRSHCDTLGRQLFPLRRWIETQEGQQMPWLIAGDFNRRLDAGAGPFQDEVWRALTGYSPDRTGQDRDGRADIAMFRSPYKEPSLCWREFRQPRPTGLDAADDYNMMPIEFFLFGATTVPLVLPGAEGQVTWPSPGPLDRRRLSDHCPSRLRIRMN
jgi:endonuclease/exonuclease/phosphatase family metal-dependent hydrolase